MSWPTATIVALLVIALTLDFVQLHQHQSDDVVFYVRPDAQLSVRELANEHGLDYVSEVFPGSNYHHALIKEREGMEKLSADSRVFISAVNQTKNH